MTTQHPLYAQKVGTNFDDKRQLLSWYSSLVDSGHRLCLFVLFAPFYLASGNTHCDTGKEDHILDEEQTAYACMK
jgi:hypothetical protein